ncbi:MAG: hypothetical protein WD226_13655 [Planctomycetota bacterium]
MQRLLPALLSVAAVGASSAAETIHVPAEFATVSAAVKAANAGDTVVIAPGTYGPVLVDRAITLVGVGSPLIVGGGSEEFEAPLALRGPGTGRVRLVGLRVGGTIDASVYAVGTAAIQGDGFESLELFDCQVDGPAWIAVGELGPGLSAVAVAVPFVVLERTIARASASLATGATAVPLPGAPGVRVAGTLLLLDSIVRGGSTGPFTHTDSGCGGQCPDSPGGDGVHANALYLAASQVSGGLGATWHDFANAVCCTCADGVAERVGERTQLGTELNGTGSASLGGALVLSWNFPQPAAGLYQSFGLAPPTTMTNSFLDLASARLLFATTTGGNLSLLVPPTATALLGLPFAFQLRFPSGAVSRPVGGVIFD